MTKEEALEYLADGHNIWSVPTARDICEALGVKWDGTSLVQPWGHEGTLGVESLVLSRYVAEKLGVADQAARLLGRGLQAREYARLIAGRV